MHQFDSICLGAIDLAQSEALKRKKAVLVEKPLAVDASQSRQIVKAAEQGAIPLMTAQTLRYEPSVLKLREIQYQIGTIEYFSGTMRLATTRLEPSPPPSALPNNHAAGIVLELGVHLFDLSLLIKTKPEVMKS